MVTEEGPKLESLAAADFEPLLRQSFLLSRADRPESLTLVEVEASRVVPPAGMRAAFSLVFEGEIGCAMLAQGNHVLRNAALGRLELFLVPIGPAASGAFRYEAIFA